MSSFVHVSPPTLYKPFSSPSIRATCPFCLILPDVITTIFSDKHRSRSSSLYILHQYPVTSTHVCPRIFLNTLFSSSLIIFSFLSVRDHVWNPYKKRKKIIVLRTLIFMFYLANVNAKGSGLNDCRHFWNLNCSWFLYSEVGTDRLTRNFGKKLPLLAA